MVVGPVEVGGLERGVEDRARRPDERLQYKVPLAVFALASLGDLFFTGSLP